MGSENGPVGSIVWTDLTVEDAEGVRDFYRSVVGWEADGVDMGGYEDFNLLNGEGEAVAGVCHARGPNADLPPAWLVYVTVEDVEESARQAREQGGEVVTGPRGLGEHGRFCVVRDPAGAVLALIEPAAAGQESGDGRGG